MLSSPAMREPPGGSLSPSALTRQQKSVSGLVKRTSNSNIVAPKTNRLTENLASSSLPSSPMSTSFADPLNDQSNGLDHTEDHDHDTVHSSTVFATPRTRAPIAKRNLHHTSSYYNQSTSSDNTNYRATIAAYPTSSAPVSTSHSPAPISNTQSSEHKVNSSPPRITRRDSQYEAQRVKAPQYLLITIPDTDRRAKDGMFVLSVQTNMPRFKRQSYNNIKRSYLEFVRLREHLVEEHPEVIVPVLPPERSLISASDIHSMRLFLERVSKHPVLSQDYELQIFIESEFGFLPPAKPTKILGKLLNIGVKRFSSGASSTLSLGDTDDEFEEERAASIKVESKLQTVIKNLDKEIKARRDFSSKESELATFCSTWAAGESMPEMARTFKMLAKPLDGIAKASKAQVGGDATVLGSFLDCKLQHVQTLSSALDYRLSVLGEYDAAIKTTESKRKTMERLRSSTNINPEKVTDSIDDLEDAVLFEGNMKMRMEQVSAALTKDLEGYRQQSQEDLLRCLRQYSQRQIGFEKAKLEELLSVAVGLNLDVDEEESRQSNEHAPEASHHHSFR